MRARPLRYDEDTGKHEQREDDRRERAAEREAAFVQGFVEEVAERCAQRPTPSERSARSAIVVPAVVEATIVAQ